MVGAYREIDRAGAYWVERDTGGTAVETRLETTLLK